MTALIFLTVFGTYFIDSNTNKKPFYDSTTMVYIESNYELPDKQNYKSESSGASDAVKKKIKKVWQ